MPSVDQVLEFRRKMFEESVAIIKEKGHDYNRQQQNSGNTLFNLQVAELLGIVPTAERGILVRLSDKFMRLISLMSPGVEAKVKGESVRDTVRDIHNYIDYCLQLWEERKQANPNTPDMTYRQLQEKERFVQAQKDAASFEKATDDKGRDLGYKISEGSKMRVKASDPYPDRIIGQALKGSKE